MTAREWRAVNSEWIANAFTFSPAPARCGLRGHEFARQPRVPDEQPLSLAHRRKVLCAIEPQRGSPSRLHPHTVSAAKPFEDPVGFAALPLPHPNTGISGCLRLASTGDAREGGGVCGAGRSGLLWAAGIAGFGRAAGTAGFGPGAGKWRTKRQRPGARGTLQAAGKIREAATEAEGGAPRAPPASEY